RRRRDPVRKAGADAPKECWSQSPPATGEIRRNASCPAPDRAQPEASNDLRPGPTSWKSDMPIAFAFRLDEHVACTSHSIHFTRVMQSNLGSAVDAGPIEAWSQFKFPVPGGGFAPQSFLEGRLGLPSMEVSLSWLPPGARMPF